MIGGLLRQIVEEILGKVRKILNAHTQLQELQ
jgi:hypothetical protein